MDKPNQNQQGNQGGSQNGNMNAKPQNTNASGTPQQAPMNMLPPSGHTQSGSNAKSTNQSNASQKTAEPSGMNWNYTLIWIVLILVVIGAGWWIGGANFAGAPLDTSTSEETMEENESPSETALSGSINTGTVPEVMVPITVAGNAIDVSNQAHGDSVVVASASLSKMGWIAVLDSRDWILGAGRFPGGTHTNVHIPLIRATESGQPYKAVIYLDDGDGKFDHKKDPRTDTVKAFSTN
jgi:hypothetical protein